MYYLLVIVLALALSFYFSGTETAFVSVNKVRVELWRRRKLPGAKFIYDFIKFPERFLYTTLIGNNLSNIAFATFATVYFNYYLDPKATWLLILILSLFFGEILPKTLFQSIADWIIRKIVYPLEFFRHLFTPISFLINKVSAFLLFALGHKPSELKRYFSKKDIEILLHETHEILSNELKLEGEFIAKVLKLKKLQVGDAMVPYTEIEAIPSNTSLGKLRKIFQKTEYSKLPVYQENLDNIVGVVILKELFLQPKRFQEMIRPVMFVPIKKRVIHLLAEFKQTNSSIAIVIDEYGGTAGLVTIEDLIEELFGEIEDEFDSQLDLIRIIDEYTFRVNARIEIEELNDAVGLEIPEGEYDTLAGFLLFQLGHIPKREEVLEYNGYKFMISSVTRRKIRWVKLILPKN